MHVFECQLRPPRYEVSFFVKASILQECDSQLEEPHNFELLREILYKSDSLILNVVLGNA